MTGLAYPEISPIIFSIGPLAVRWYSMAYLIGIISAWLLVKRQVRIYNIPLTKENLDDLVFDVAEDYILGRFVPIDEKIRQIESVTRDDLLASARRIFSHRPTYGVIGEAKNFPSHSDVLSMLCL